MARLAAILRVAVGLDRGRTQSVESLEVDQQGARVRVLVQSTGDCELELWAAQRQGDLFRRAFGRKLEVRAAGRRDTEPEPFEFQWPVEACSDDPAREPLGATG